MASEKFTMVFREGTPLAGGRHPGFKPRTEKGPGMIIDYDVAVKMRDGIKIYIDRYYPETEGKYPVIIAWGPYGKFTPQTHDWGADRGLSHGDFSEYCKFESPDPAYWCPWGYIIISADPRGTWNSEGDATFFSEQEAQDCYDLIEWAGTQSWSNGKVGMLGVSYLAWIQWRVAALNPPHLAAISPWDGVSDFYREAAYHGGMLDTGWWLPFGNGLSSRTTTRAEDVAQMTKEHPLFDDYWASKNADLSKITVPAFVCASWCDQPLHTRGTLEAFKKMASKDKWLYVHGRLKWQHFLMGANVTKQRQFFNRFLKGLDNRVKNWPKVTLEIREKFYIGNTRTENEWPLARTQYTKLFLNATDGKMSKSPLTKEAQVRYNVDDISDKTQNAKFEFKFDEKTELTGHMKLKLWVQADGSDDMDLFVAIEKIDRAGYIIGFPFHSHDSDGPVALGHLRVSHRELDEERSTPYQPFRKHQREIKLKAGEIVPVEIEIWPSGTLFERGEKLRAVVQGSDIYWHVEQPLRGTSLHMATVNKGKHVLYTGGKYDSHLLVPVIPEQET